MERRRKGHVRVESAILASLMLCGMLRLRNLHVPPQLESRVRSIRIRRQSLRNRAHAEHNPGGIGMLCTKPTPDASKRNKTGR